MLEKTGHGFSRMATNTDYDIFNPCSSAKSVAVVDGIYVVAEA
jgi:hypothetical protein